MNEFKTVIVATGIFQDSKRVLLLKRSTRNNSFKNYWQLPEGKLEFGEQPIEALKREIKEELGLKVEKSQLVGVYSAITRVSKTNYFIVRIVFRCRTKGQILLSEDHRKAEWIDLKQARKLKKTMPGVIEVLGDLH